MDLLRCERIASLFFLEDPLACLLGWSHLHKLTQHTPPWDCLASRKLEPASKASTSVDQGPQLGNGNGGNCSALVEAVPSAPEREG